MPAQSFSGHSPAQPLGSSSSGGRAWAAPGIRHFSAAASQDPGYQRRQPEGGGGQRREQAWATEEHRPEDWNSDDEAAASEAQAAFARDWPSARSVLFPVTSSQSFTGWRAASRFGL